MVIDLPNRWEPREYQHPMWRYLAKGGTRVVIRWHRRAGKDDICLHWAAVAAHKRVGNYWHMLPEYSQGRKAIWEAINPHTGERRIDEAFPKILRRRTLNDEMFIEFRNGSTFRCLGSDRYNSNVGAPPAGVTFSEYALSNPSAWDYIRPMLAENGGWALFNSTVRGRNHFWKIGEFAQKEPGWYFSQVDADKSGVFTAEQLDTELRELVGLYGEDEGTAKFRQEYFNDPSAAIPGAYYGREMSRAEGEGRISTVPWEPRILVTTAWDLGIGDSTAIWFCQQVGKERRIIDYYEASGVGLEHYAKILREKPYAYHEHILPHDAAVTELGTGQSRMSILQQLGVRPQRILPAISVEEGIQAVRAFLPGTWFDRTKCERGIECLTQYQRQWDDKLKAFKTRPLHDWTSHAADAFRYLAVGLRPVREAAPARATAERDYSIFGG